MEGGDEGISFWVGWALAEGGGRMVVKDRL